MASLKEALATLAMVPPKAFTRQRDALAARLREAGDTTTAAQVKARRVPTVPVWIVNRLALEHPDDVEALIAAAERVKAAQLGRGQAGTLATATAGHRAALERLRARAGVMLREAGGGATPDKLLRVQHTLTAAAVDAQARTALQAGHLERELTAPGFDVFGGARPPAPRRTQREGARPRAQTVAPPARTAAVASPGAAKAEERRRVLEAERAARQEHMERARTALTEAQRQAVAAHKDATEAAGRLNELLEQAQQARQALRERTTAAGQLDMAVKHAQRALRTAARKAGP
jgi:hypothetical protein